jgi:hypothetical protein
MPELFKEHILNQAIVRFDEALIDQATDAPEQVGTLVLQQATYYKDAVFESIPTRKDVSIYPNQQERRTSLSGLMRFAGQDPQDGVRTDIVMHRPSHIAKYVAKLFHKEAPLAKAYVEISTNHT